MKLLVAMIVRKGREKYIPNVAKSFNQMYDQAKKIGRGTIVSAVALTDGQVKEIQRTLESTTGKSFELTEEVDPSLIGGFVLKVGDTLFDGSVGSALRRVKQSLK